VRYDVQQEQIRLAPLNLGQRCMAIMGDGDVVAGAAEIEGHQLGQVGLVLYH
jgi:hypothetical protein